MKSTVIFTIGIFVSSIIVELIFTDSSLLRIIIFASIFSLLMGVIWHFSMPSVKKNQEKRKCDFEKCLGPIRN
jgi:hypothetical protein